MSKLRWRDANKRSGIARCDTIAEAEEVMRELGLPREPWPSIPTIIRLTDSQPGLPGLAVRIRGDSYEISDGHWGSSRGQIIFSVAAHCDLIPLSGSRWRVPPGRIIARELEARGWSHKELARLMGWPEQAINELVNNKKRITTETARDLAIGFGTSAEFWINLEKHYRQSNAAHVRNPPLPPILC